MTLGLFRANGEPKIPGDIKGLPVPVERRAMDSGVKRESPSYSVVPGVDEVTFESCLGVTGGGRWDLGDGDGDRSR